jgi:propionyl-CoA synthetase
VWQDDDTQYWRMVEQHRLSSFFTAPTALRAIKQRDPSGEHLKRFDLSSLRSLFVAGERADPDTIKWIQGALPESASGTAIDVVDHFWQTESGSPIIAHCLGYADRLAVRPGSAFKGVPGYDVRIVDDDGVEVPRGESGNVALKLPLAPGALTGLWEDSGRFRSAYLERFPGYYDTSDAGYIDADGYVFVMSRTDDVISVAGHRISAGALEEALSDHADVAEVAVVGVADALRGQMPLACIVLNAGFSGDQEALKTELIASVRRRVGAVAALKTICIVKGLPKTRSGKILRRIMRSIADRQPYVYPATIEDGAVLDELKVLFDSVSSTSSSSSSK